MIHSSVLGYSGIPHEVVEAACWAVGHSPLDVLLTSAPAPHPEHILFVPKATVSRSEGWNQVLAKHPRTYWHKCHTRNYWAWVDTLKPNPYHKPRAP